MNKDTIKGIVESLIFKPLDYEVLKNNLEYTFTPYKKYGSDKIVFEVTGSFDDLQKFNSIWNELEKIESSKPTQAEYTFFEKSLFTIGNFLKFSFLPIAKITNKGQTEFYTLYNNGMVKIKGVGSKVTDAVLINMCSSESILEFETAVNKIKIGTNMQGGNI